MNKVQVKAELKMPNMLALVGLKHAARIMGIDWTYLKKACRSGTLAHAWYGPFRLTTLNAIKAWQRGEAPAVWPKPGELFSVTQAAERIGLSRQQIRNLAMSGDISCTRYGRYRLFTAEQILKYGKVRAGVA